MRIHDGAGAAFVAACFIVLILFIVFGIYIIPNIQ